MAVKLCLSGTHLFVKYPIGSVVHLILNPKYWKQSSPPGPPSCVCGQKMACQGVHNNFVGFKVILDLFSLVCSSIYFVLVVTMSLLLSDSDATIYDTTNTADSCQPQPSLTTPVTNIQTWKWQIRVELQRSFPQNMYLLHSLPEAMALAIGYDENN